MKSTICLRIGFWSFEHILLTNLKLVSLYSSHHSKGMHYKYKMHKINNRCSIENLKYVHNAGWANAEYISYQCMWWKQSKQSNKKVARSTTHTIETRKHENMQSKSSTIVKTKAIIYIQWFCKLYVQCSKYQVIPCD